MKELIICGFLLAMVFSVYAQNKVVPLLYDPKADAGKEIKTAVARAAKEKKYVLLQMGGNWCPWCIRLNRFITEDAQLDSVVKANYIVYHLNYSKENKNFEQFKKYGFPQRFGFPVLVVLDGEGHRLHTQNSAYLEEGEGYSKGKVMDFLLNWSPGVLDASRYY